jgi:hypothetical protein
MLIDRPVDVGPDPATLTEVSSTNQRTANKITSGGKRNPTKPEGILANGLER